MTDIEKVKNLFNELEIGYRFEHRDNTKLGKYRTDEPDYTQVLILEAKVHEKVKGYTGFTSEYEFDETGVFLQVSNWE